MGKRQVRAIVGLIAPVLLLAACSSGPDIKAGADVDAAGPHYSPAPVAASGQPAAEPTAAATPAATPSADAAGALRVTVAGALSATDPVAASTLAVEQRPFAGNQLVFTWTASDDPKDTGAKARVRAQALVILEQARHSGLSYGSVLLMASAVVSDAGGRKTEVVAVRAKYTRALVLRTDFTKVSPANVFKLPDDKPAEIDPHFA
jgi:hypothetical protein